MRGEGGLGGALKTFEFGLLGSREARGRGGRLEGGGVSEGARRVEGCDSAERAKEAGHVFLFFLWLLLFLGAVGEMVSRSVWLG